MNIFPPLGQHQEDTLMLCEIYMHCNFHSASEVHLGLLPSVHLCKKSQCYLDTSQTILQVRFVKYLCGHVLMLPSVTYRSFIQVRHVLLTILSAISNLSPRSMTLKPISSFISTRRYSSAIGSLCAVGHVQLIFFRSSLLKSSGSSQSPSNIASVTMAVFFLASLSQ